MGYAAASENERGNAQCCAAAHERPALEFTDTCHYAALRGVGPGSSDDSHQHPNETTKSRLWQRFSVVLVPLGVAVVITQKYHLIVKRRTTFLIALLVVVLAALVPLTDHYAFAPKASNPPPNAANVRRCLRTKVLTTAGTSFRYPSCWTLSNYTEESTMTTVVAFLSNQPMRQPCTTTRSGISTTVSCGFPVKSLERGGVLVTFIAGGMPGWTIAGDTGRHLVVDHHAAREIVIRKPNRSLDATAQYSIFIDRGVPDNYYQFDVYFRNPGVLEDQRLLRTMLNSMKIQ